MNNDDFQVQIKRLIETYGDKAFPSERIKLVWSEGHAYPIAAFKQICDKFIGEMRFAPTVKDFRLAYSDVREKQNANQKTKHEREAKEFWQNTLPDDDVRMIMGTIKKRMTGTIKDNDWRQFMEVMKTMADKVDACPCQQTGVVKLTNNKLGGIFRYKCNCERGRSIYESIPQFHRDLLRDYEIA